MAPGMESPHSPPPPRPPNARAWWEAAGSFREEQKGPADLSILLGWCLGHLEDDGNQPGLEWAGSCLLTRDVCVCTGMGVGKGVGDLSALSRGIWGVIISQDRVTPPLLTSLGEVRSRMLPHGHLVLWSPSVPWGLIHLSVGPASRTHHFCRFLNPRKIQLAASLENLGAHQEPRAAACGEER